MRYLLLGFTALALFAQSTDLTQALQPSRQRIDSIDDQIVKLLNERAQVVREVGLIKKRFNAPVSAPGREEQVLRRAAAQAQAPLTGPAVGAIFKVVLREMSAMEEKQ
jgi:chorismate mutase / prephenate dehydratase